MTRLGLTETLDNQPYVDLEFVALSRSPLAID